MPSLSENLFFAEPLLIEMVREAVPELKSVKGWTGVPDTIEAAGATPCAFVIYEGASKATNVGGVATLSGQYWTVAVVVRRGESQATQTAQREQAGVFLAKIYKALQGQRFDGCKPLTLIDGPSAKYYPGGQAIFYLTFCLTGPQFPR